MNMYRRSTDRFAVYQEEPPTKAEAEADEQRDERRCHGCNGNGVIDCEACDGQGDIPSGGVQLGGFTFPTVRECQECDGIGLLDCEDCDSSGYRDN